jgi:hypothetical protein
VLEEGAVQSTSEGQESSDVSSGEEAQERSSHNMVPVYPIPSDIQPLSNK